jgi:hypothetical protein
LTKLTEEMEDGRPLSYESWKWLTVALICRRYVPGPTLDHWLGLTGPGVRQSATVQAMIRRNRCLREAVDAISLDPGLSLYPRCERLAAHVTECTKAWNRAYREMPEPPAAWPTWKRHLFRAWRCGNPVMTDGIPLFHADHKNLAAAGSAITLESLGAARAAMRQQKGPGNIGYIDPRPAFLIVPVALETLAEQLLASLVDPAKSNDTPNVAWIRALTVIADPRLDEDNPAAWYLAASPAQLDTIVRAYILGEDRPYYEEKIGFEVDGMEIKSRLDIGVGAIDFRGLYKNPGAN